MHALRRTQSRATIGNTHLSAACTYPLKNSSIPVKPGEGHGPRSLDGWVRRLFSLMHNKKLITSMHNVLLCTMYYYCVHVYNVFLGFFACIIGASRSEPHTTEFYAFLGILYIYILSIRTTSDKVRMRQMFHVKHGVDAPPTTCMRSPKKKKAQKSMLRHSYRYQQVFSH